VKIDGTWFFKSVRWYDLFIAPYETGWVKGTFPNPDDKLNHWVEMPLK